MGLPGTPLPACPAQEPLLAFPSPPSLPCAGGTYPQASAPGHGVLGRTERSEGPQLLQSCQGCSCPTLASQHCKVSAPSMPQINWIPRWVSDKAPPPPVVQTWRPGQAQVEPEPGGTWGPHRRTWGWGTHEARAHEGLAARGGPSKHMWYTQGHCLARSQARARRGPWGRVQPHSPGLLVSRLFNRQPSASISVGLPPSGPSSPG